MNQQNRLRLFAGVALALGMTLSSQAAFALGGAVESREPISSWYMAGQNCTAVQIGRRLLVTAAHCVRSIRSREGFPESSLKFFPLNESGANVTVSFEVRVSENLQLKRSATNPSDRGQAPVVETIYLHPSWEQRLMRAKSPEELADNPAVSDIAVIALETDLPGPVARVAAPGELAIADRLVIGGFGRERSSFQTDYTHARPVVIEAHEHHLILGNESPKWQSGKSFGATKGDSGGGTFIWSGSGLEESETTVVAISSVLWPKRGYDHYLLKVARLDSPQVYDWLKTLIENVATRDQQSQPPNSISQPSQAR